MRVRLPYLDQALGALIEDIHARGLDEKIMVVVMGEFGRTPRLSVNTRASVVITGHRRTAHSCQAVD